MRETDAHELLDQVNSVRARVRNHSRPGRLGAVLIGAVALVGALAFVASDQLVSVLPGCDAARQGCSTSHRGFNGAWAWHLGAVVAIGYPFFRRYRAGSWRPSTPLVVAVAGAVVLLGPSLLQTQHGVPAVAYPAATAVALGVMGWSRRLIGVVVVSIVLAVGVLLAHWIAFEAASQARWYFAQNLGLAGLSVIVGLAALIMSNQFDRRDQS